MSKQQDSHRTIKLYTDMEFMARITPKEDAYAILNGIFSYAKKGEEPEFPEDSVSWAVWNTFKEKIDAGREADAKKSETNSANARKRYEGRMQSDANGCDGMQSDANAPTNTDTSTITDRATLTDSSISVNCDSDRNFNLTGMRQEPERAALEARAWPGAPDGISLERAKFTRDMNKIPISDDGIRAFFYRMDEQKWKIGNHEVTDLNKAMRWFLKKFPQYSESQDPEDEPQPARKRSYEEMEEEFFTWIEKIEEAPEAGGLSICQKCPDGCADCYKNDDCKAALKERLEKYLTSKRYKRFADYLDFTEDVSISEYAAFLIPAHKLDMKTRTYCEDFYGAVFPEKGTELIPLSFLDELLDAFDEARPELEKKRQEEEEAREQKKAEDKAASEKRGREIAERLLAQEEAEKAEKRKTREEKNQT